MTPGVILRSWRATWSANGRLPRYRLLHASQQRRWKPSSSAKTIEGENIGDSTSRERSSCSARPLQFWLRAFATSSAAPLSRELIHEGCHGVVPYQPTLNARANRNDRGRLRPYLGR